MQRVILDTDAFVLYLLAEEGGAIQRILREAEAGAKEVMMNSYNLAEVYVHLSKRLSGDQLDEIVRAAYALPIRRIPVSDTLVFAAARLRASYEFNAATAMAVATALQEDALLITGQPLLRTPEGVAVCPVVGRNQAPSSRQMQVLMGLAN